MKSPKLSEPKEKALLTKLLHQFTKVISNLLGMAIPVVEFSRNVYKIRKVFWLKINCSQMKWPNFDNWKIASFQKLGIILGNNVLILKGQLISECLFDFLNFPKNQRKIWKISAQETKSGQINKVKALSNNIMIIWAYI